MSAIYYNCNYITMRVINYTLADSQSVAQNKYARENNLTYLVVTVRYVQNYELSYIVLAMA